MRIEKPFEWQVVDKNVENLWAKGWQNVQKGLEHWSGVSVGADHSDDSSNKADYDSEAVCELA
ncbi:hypothetical protein PVL30_002826 [Lodderomyces elongisporus]|uniref:uncharacterized protein n=1 Tax=Lodderomyces elongisporus TaxID=36914 RepID=UPI00291F2137|nr:uncharacterized protein PVL30_002826 [Lodderomyces elongisporus]WLF79075.1 hypothetical protein PVL30_002826 [Lodderomyces elongisporus]